MNAKLKQALKHWHDAEVRLNQFDLGMIEARKGACERARETAKAKLLKLTREVFKLKSTLVALLLCAFAPLRLPAVQQPESGVFQMGWRSSLTNPIIDTCVWESTNGGVKWKQVGETRAETFSWTNRNITPLTRYAITQMGWQPPGSQDIRPMTEMTLLHWAPSGTNTTTNAANYVRLVEVDVPAGQPVKISSDFKTFDDWMQFRVRVGPVELTNAVVMVRHKTSPLKPWLFTAYPEAGEETILLTAAAAPATNTTKSLPAAAKPPPLP